MIRSSRSSRTAGSAGRSSARKYAPFEVPPRMSMQRMPSRTAPATSTSALVTVVFRLRHDSGTPRSASVAADLLRSRLEFDAGAVRGSIRRLLLDPCIASVEDVGGRSRAARPSTPSSSATTTSPGLHRRPRRRSTGTLTDPGVALTVPCAWTALDHTGKPIERRSATSRTPVVVTRPRTPRTCSAVAMRSPMNTVARAEVVGTTTMHVADLALLDRGVDHEVVARRGQHRDGRSRDARALLDRTDAGPDEPCPAHRLVHRRRLRDAASASTTAASARAMSVTTTGPVMPGRP